MGLNLGPSRSTRNDPPDLLVIVCGILLLLIGLPLSLILIGIPLVAFGGYILYVGIQMQKARTMLDEAISRTSPAGMG